MHACMYACMYACMHVCHVCMYVCMYACMYVVYVCMHVCKLCLCMHVPYFCSDSVRGPSPFKYVKSSVREQSQPAESGRCLSDMPVPATTAWGGTTQSPWQGYLPGDSFTGPYSGMSREAARQRRLGQENRRGSSAWIGARSHFH